MERGREEAERGREEAERGREEAERGKEVADRRTVKTYMFRRPILTSTNGAESIKHGNGFKHKKHECVCVCVHALPPRYACREGSSSLVCASPAGHCQSRFIQFVMQGQRLRTIVYQPEVNLIGFGDTNLLLVEFFLKL